MKESLSYRGTLRTMTLLVSKVQRDCFNNEGCGQQHQTLQGIQMREGLKSSYWIWVLGDN